MGCNFTNISFVKWIGFAILHLLPHFVRQKLRVVVVKVNQAGSDLSGPNE